MSGLKIQVHKTTVVDGKEVNEIDASGKEIVLYEIEVPRQVEAEGPAAVEAHVEAESIKQKAAIAAKAAVDAAPPIAGVADVAFKE